MDSALNWESHVDSVCNKIRSVLYRLKRMYAFTNIESRRKLVSTLIFPLFDYCSAVFGDLSGKLDSKLQVALNSCVRYVYGLNWRSHITPYRKQLQWMSARNRRLFLSTCLLHKILLKSSPSYLSDLFVYRVPIHASRRLGPQIRIPFSPSQQLLDSFSFHTANFWNSLPHPLRLAESVQLFKNLLKNHLLQSELSQSEILLTP